jgi:hypothetical protein
VGKRSLSNWVSQLQEGPVERLSTFCRSPLAATRGTIRTPPEGKRSPRHSSSSNGSSNDSALGWGASRGAKGRGACQDGADRVYRDGVHGDRSGEVRGANSVRVGAPAADGGSLSPDPPTLRPTATSTSTAVELQEVLVQPPHNLDTDDHHACLDSFRPAAVEQLQLDEPQESELSIPKPGESRDATPGVDLPVRSNINGLAAPEAMAAAPPVRKRQHWRRSSTLVEDLQKTTTRRPPSAQNRRSSWRCNLPLALSPNSSRARSLSAPPGLRRTSSASGMAASGMAAFQREMSKCGQGLSRASQDAYDKGRGSASLSFPSSFSSSSNPGLAAVKREMNKNEQELLNKPNTWRLKTYYVFPLLAKLRHADHPSRIIFPAVYIIFVFAMLSEVNFGVRGALEHQPSCEPASSRG